MAPDSESNSPPHVVLMKLVQGVMVAKALQAVAELGIADRLKDSPKTSEDLAKLTSTHASSIFRLLRALASIGIFRQDELGRFENTALSEPLCSDSLMSVRDYVIYAPHDGNMLAWMRLMSVLQTGEPSFADATGVDLWAYFRKHPEIGERFNQAMTSLAAGSNRMVLQGYDFTPFRTIVDVGGGQGLLLAAILKAIPHLRGLLFDLPAVAEGAKVHLQIEGVADRSHFLAGDAFESIPSGYDAYIMKNVLHDWNDDKAAVLLERCRRAIPDHGKLIIVDAVMVPGNDPHPAKWFDLHMMVALGGRERTEDEFRRLLRDAGFTLMMVKSLPAPIGIVEAVPS
jgi:SAM-dependent methyltransferase